MSLVSIIMPYYKKKNFINKTINSILNQSYKNFEIILINDEINYDSLNFLKKISKLDSRIHLIENDNNLGAGNSRNKAIEIAKGEYIAFCDCDDLWKSNKLEAQIKFMKTSNFDFCFTAYEIIDENEKIISSRKVKKYIDFNELKKSCDIGLSTVLLKKKILNEKKYRFPDLITKEDYVLWLMLAKDGIQLMGLDENLVKWRKCKNSLSSSTFQKLKDGYKVYRNYLGYGKLKSLFYLINLSINFILKN